MKVRQILRLSNIEYYLAAHFLFQLGIEAFKWEIDRFYIIWLLGEKELHSECRVFLQTLQDFWVWYNWKGINHRWFHLEGLEIRSDRILEKINNFGSHVLIILDELAFPISNCSHLLYQKLAAPIPDTYCVHLYWRFAVFPHNINYWIWSHFPICKKENVSRVIWNLLLFIDIILKRPQNLSSVHISLHFSNLA